MTAHAFELDGKTFRVEPLKLSKQLRLYALVAPIASTLVSAFKGSGEDPKHLVAALDGLGEIKDMFLGLTKVEGVADAGAVPLNAVQDQVFQRRAVTVLGWLVQCIKGELGDFLPGSGRNPASLLAELGFKFPAGSTGGSTGSGPTPAQG